MCIIIIHSEVDFPFVKTISLLYYTIYYNEIISHNYEKYLILDKFHSLVSDFQQVVVNVECAGLLHSFHHCIQYNKRTCSAYPSTTMYNKRWSIVRMHKTNLFNHRKHAYLICWYTMIRPFSKVVLINLKKWSLLLLFLLWY